jgi:hypothetical protein
MAASKRHTSEFAKGDASLSSPQNTSAEMAYNSSMGYVEPQGT